MPLFRLKDPMPHLVDATFLHDENPDPERYAEVPESEAPAEPVAEAPPAPEAPQPEEA